ncbi:uncharacterized protein LOC120902336 isoform X2 [Anopheles arabiensis]|uniref:uncharacterized protein LOC120902336 isoform X2 n=1 Tax=Anopheles arabiensis TaxID=7173 RepID=UPI001AACE7C6|nr:uncharacterized protein LOC120902336 isoform X2 [Anopheles arabiensis]
MTQATDSRTPPAPNAAGTRPRINLTMPPVYVAPPSVQAQHTPAKYSPAHYFQQLHQQQQQQAAQMLHNPLYQPGVPVTPGSPTRISLGTDGGLGAGGEQPDYTDYYSMYPAKAGEFMFKQFEGFRDFTLNTAKSGLGVGEKSVFWMYTKITKWSRKWFTHFFLFLILFLYSVAGAALFVAVEGEADNPPEVDVASNGFNETAAIAASAAATAAAAAPTNASFMALEPTTSVFGTHEKKMETNVNHAKRMLAKNLRILALDREKLENPDPDIWEGRAINLVEEYSAVLYQSYKEGSFENKQNKKTWSFWNAVFYCGTIYTTIGYGHISPSTTTGRALTILYAIIGIPIFLIVLADFGKLFTRGIKFMWAYVRRLYYTGSVKKVRKTAQVQEVMKGLNVVYDMVRRPSADNELQGATTTTTVAAQQPQQSTPPPPVQRPPSEAPTAAASGTGIEAIPVPDTPTTPVPETFEIDDEFNLPISVAIVILVAYMLFGAQIYCTWENWSFFEAFYFVFISISTIGFGDYVPQHPIYMMCSILYLIFGLALTSMCINVVQLKLSDSFRQASAKIGATIGLQMAEAASQHQHSPVHTPIELAAVHTSTPTSAVNVSLKDTPTLPARPSSSVPKPDKKE